LNAIQGWFMNQLNRKTTNQDVGTYVAKGAVRVVAYFVSWIPVFGTLLTMAVDEQIAYTKRKFNEGEVQAHGDHEVTGIFLAEHGFQAYLDALRKLNQAEIDYNKQPVGNCRDFAEKIARFYYWKYRLERLAYYHAMVESYTKRVATAMASAEATLKSGQTHMNTNAPKLFEDWSWHAHQCKDFCLFPYETLEMSAPTNVVHTVGSYIPGPNAMKPVRVIPTGHGNALPLPPRPPKKA
ncbi:MAG TPA: hypothetical protein VJN70_11285, partial [Gemmatimonadaceae bacterium]|nr:hypothetical protein [Gemmatimonadaceae bacterium]